jgi:protein-S-isoprenylcysteine O-methyltransferase Ste14
MPAQKTPNRMVIPGIMLGLVAWALFLALGDYLANHNPRRPLVIITCVALFIGFWLAILRWRRAGGRSNDDLR